MNFILDAIIMPLRLFIWLNPEPSVMWQGDNDMPKYAPLCSNILKGSNLRELVQAVDALMGVD
jgi:hypothetical protein